MRGKTLLENETTLGTCVETAVFGHLYAHSTFTNARFSYWQKARTKELDLVVEIAERLIPFEVKYQSQEVTARNVSALVEFCQREGTQNRGYILTKSPQDVGPLKHEKAHLLRIPASLFCYWIGEAELTQKSICSIN